MTRAEKYARLVNINLNSPEEEKRVEEALSNMVKIAEVLSSVDTEGVEPLFCSLEEEYLLVEKESEKEMICTMEVLPQGAESCDNPDKTGAAAKNIEDIFLNSAIRKDNFFVSPGAIKK